MSDTGEDAIRREVAECEAGERVRTYTDGGYQLTIFDDAVTYVERTEAEQSAFAAKMAEWRRTGGVPGYTGPRAAR